MIDKKMKNNYQYLQNLRKMMIHLHLKKIKVKRKSLLNKIKSEVIIQIIHQYLAQMIHILIVVSTFLKKIGKKI